VYKAIVVGTDGSPTAAYAVQKAIELAQSSGAVLHVIHAHQLVDITASAAVSGANINYGAVNDGIREDSDRICDNAVELAGRVGVTVETHSIPGSPANALIQVAENVGADLIVVGNRGMTGAKRFVLGSVPNKVSHHAPCDLLIVNTAQSG
jgi:nucleotide-binding universal stress UspA family protein